MLSQSSVRVQLQVDRALQVAAYVAPLSKDLADIQQFHLRPSLSKDSDRIICLCDSVGTLSPLVKVVPIPKIAWRWFRGSKQPISF